MATSSSFSTFHTHSFNPFLSKPKPQRFKLQPIRSFSDPLVLKTAEIFEDSHPITSSPTPSLQKLRDTSSQSLLSTSWPTRKDEPYRYFDTSSIKKSKIKPISTPPTPSTSLQDSLHAYTPLPNLVFVDGHMVNSSKTEDFPEGVYIGSVDGIDNEVVKNRVLECVSEFQYGDLFWALNGIGAPDITVVYVPADCRVENPLHLMFVPSESGDVGTEVLPVSNPRVLVLVEKGGEIGIIEEYFGGEDGDWYWMNSAIEVLIESGGKVVHSYVQKQGPSSAHTKWTFVRQEASSTYKLVEVGTGGKLSRHNLYVQQMGPETATDLATFHLCVNKQTLDLNNRGVLNHPRGAFEQLHKCIVANSSGQANFDGNIQVNRYAQQTNASQTSRALPLVYRATVNQKPNLQIIADDVKCKHGATTSALEEDQLFYFLARGIDSKTAKKALLYSFGAEVIEQLPYKSLQKKVALHVKELLDSLQ